jgi:hypothetical protein
MIKFFAVVSFLINIPILFCEESQRNDANFKFKKSFGLRELPTFSPNQLADE